MLKYKGVLSLSFHVHGTDKHIPSTVCCYHVLSLLPPTFMHIGNTLWVASSKLMDIKFSVLFFSNNLVLFFCYMPAFPLFSGSVVTSCAGIISQINIFPSFLWLVPVIFSSNLPFLATSPEFFIFYHEGLTFVYVEITVSMKIFVIIL